MLTVCKVSFFPFSGHIVHEKVFLLRMLVSTKKKKLSQLAPILSQPASSCCLLHALGRFTSLSVNACVQYFNISQKYK